MVAEPSPVEHTALTAQEALRERLLGLFRCEVVETCWAHGWAPDEGDLDVVDYRFDTGGAAAVIETICADPHLCALALDPNTKITTEGMATEKPLFKFDNGGDGDPLSCDPEADESWCNIDFPLGIAMVIYGDCVASANPPTGRGAPGHFVRLASHRRREASYFRAAAQERRGGEDRAHAFADALEEMAEACDAEFKVNDSISHELRKTRFEMRMEQAAHQRGRVAVSGLRGRRLDRRLGGQRGRQRALVRSYSRGGDSGSDSESEPAGDGDPAGVVSQAFAALRRWWP